MAYNIISISVIIFSLLCWVYFAPNYLSIVISYYGLNKNVDEETKFNEEKEEQLMKYTETNILEKLCNLLDMNTDKIDTQ